MAQDSSVIFPRDIVDHFVTMISRKIPVEGVLLFGSFAYGNPTRHSDVDLVIISPDFKKMDFWDRVGWLSQQRDKTSMQAAMDIFGYTPEEFAHAHEWSSIMAKAKREGVWLRKPVAVLHSS